MAGIGFRLRALASQETISSIVAAAGHAAVIAAGPWLFTIIALFAIALITDQVAGTQVLSNFRAIIIYAFATSLVLASPVTIVATRLVGDALWLKQPRDVPKLLLGAYGAVLLPVALGVALEIWWFRLAAGTAIALMASSVLVALIWVALAFCGAVRDYRGVTLSFLIGLIVALVSTVAAAIFGLDSVGMAWGFISGLTVTFTGLTSRVFATFPDEGADPIAGLRDVVRGIGHYQRLVIGALLGTAAVWIDKVVFWFSSEGSQLSNGLLHAPLYDSTMFIASLALVPPLASFVMSLETGFFDRYQQYFATIGNHGTLTQIEAARSRLATYTLESLTLITVTLSGLAAILILIAPIVIDALGLQFRQIAILRYGALGAVFHFVLIAASSILLFFDRRRRYMLLQALFLVLNGGLAALSLHMGEDYYGTGYFLACMISAAVAYQMATDTLQRLNFLTFLGNNPSIVGAKGARFVWLDRVLSPFRSGKRRI